MSFVVGQLLRGSLFVTDVCQSEERALIVALASRTKPSSFHKLEYEATCAFEVSNIEYSVFNVDAPFVVRKLIEVPNQRFCVDQDPTGSLRTQALLELTYNLVSMTMLQSELRALGKYHDHTV